MINLTQLNKFKEKISAVKAAQEVTMTEAHKITSIKAQAVDFYEEIIAIVDDNHKAIQDCIIETIQKSINGALGKTDEPRAKKTKR